MKTSVRLVLAAFALAGALSGALTQPKPHQQASATVLSGTGGPVPMCPPSGCDIPPQ